jgi:hypothetical protein
LDHVGLESIVPGEIDELGEALGGNLSQLGR